MSRWTISAAALVVLANGLSAPDAAHSAIPVTPSSEISSEWSPLRNAATYATNFEKKHRGSREAYNQIVTIYNLPMTADRRLGKEISKGEYVEVFKTGDARLVTVRIRLDRGSFWLMSRQTFHITEPSLVAHDPELGDDERQSFIFALQDEIDETRYLLRNKFN